MFFSAVLVCNRVWFVHSSLELGMFFRRISYLHPHPIFLEVPPPGTFLSLWIRNGGSLCQAFLADTVETGTKNGYVMEATHVLRRKLRKD